MQLDYNQKVLIVDSPVHGKDKIGRVPAGQAFIPSPPNSSHTHPLPPQLHSPFSTMPSTDSANARFRLSMRPKQSPTAPPRTPPNDAGPAVPPKDGHTISLLSTPESSKHGSVDLSADSPAYALRRGHLARTMSISSLNSLSRLSFQSQIGQLTSISLPDADTLSGSIAAISTSPKVARTLIDAASQIQGWMSKATDVLDGLEAAGDAEWAAAAGRDGVGQVDGAIKRFEKLIQVYIAAVEDLQSRDDAVQVTADDMKLVVAQLEKIVLDWHKIKESLTNVKKQVELALEWSTLRDSVTSEIGSEIKALSRQIFEMEERRHMANFNPGLSDNALAGVDIGDLETIVEEAPHDPTRLLKANASPVKHRAEASQDDTDLLGLFAQMQPLRASLDFLPMRFAGFQNRAKKMFPNACEDLDLAREQMEEQWKHLESDAESLRRELGEDRWILVFRNAGKKAMTLIDSVARAISKLDESLDSNTKLRHSASTLKKMESYEAKKLHYCPAIERVIGIVDRGVKDRLTVNGEILRLQHELQMKYQTIKTDIKEMDANLETYEKFTVQQAQQLRDSVSSILSSDPSFLNSSLDTPGSSSASSVHTPDRRLSGQPPLPDNLTPAYSAKPRQLSGSSTSSKPSYVADSRVPSTPLPSKIPRKTPVTRSSAADLTLSARQSSLSPNYRAPLSPASSIASSSRYSVKSAPSSANRPRWNGSRVSDASAFPFDHPHPGRPPTPPSANRMSTYVKTAPSSRRPSSSLAATPLATRRLSRPPSSAATPSPQIGRTSATPTGNPLAKSWGPSTTQRHSRLPSSVGEEPTSPSPARPVSSFGGSRPGSSLASRESSLPLPHGSPRVAPSPGPYAQRFASPGPYAQRLASKNPDTRRLSNMSNMSAASRASTSTAGTVRR